MKQLLFLLSLAISQALLAQQPATSVKGASPTNALLEIDTGTTTRAVVVGISDYQDPAIPDLRFADRDAEAFANFLRSPAGGSLDGDHLIVLLNSEATLGQFAAALDWLMEVTKEGDNAIVYFSGHGDVEKKTLTQPGFLLCWDAPSRIYMSGGAFGLSYLQEVLSTLSVQNKAKVVVITDACRSGNLAGQSVGGAQATAANLAKQYANEIKILSCQPNEYSIEGEQWGGGRGAFSFNLLDALYGLADGNNDLFVTLQEVGRYLEDHVTAEVAPVSQVPMVIGNRTERLASVDSKLLANLRSGRTSQMKMLSPIESRGMEDDVLAGVDTTVRELYRLFKKALKDKVFLEPANACADAYYEQLMAEAKMQRLHSTMTRNYAAALQDDAQQAMNIWLAADVQQLECIGKSLKLEPIPRQLARAAELLGEGHYMYRSLQARKLLFEGISMMRHTNPDEVLGRQCLSVFRKSHLLEPNSPLPWHRMCLVYAENLLLPDSAFICAQEARNLAPNWVLPLAYLASSLTGQRKFDAAKQALLEAEAIDSLHPYVISHWARWYYFQGGQLNLEKAVALLETYRQSGGAIYPCWYSHYSNALVELGNYEAAEEEILKAIALDSNFTAGLVTLGKIYNNTRQFSKAEPVMKKLVELDSMNAGGWNNLGSMYNRTQRYAEAEMAFKKSIALDSTNIVAWANLGSMYANSRRYAEAEPVLKKTIALDSTLKNPWSNLGYLYTQTSRYAEAEPALKKAVALDSNYAIAWGRLGYVYLQTRRYAEAEQAYKKVVGLDSTNATTRRQLGVVYFKTNRPDEARQNFLKALELNTNYAGAMLGMAYLLTADKKTEEAIGYVEQAIGKGSTFEQLEKDEDLAPLRATPEWKELMKKHFPDQIKD